MPPYSACSFHCLLYREHISSWGAAGLFQFPLLREGRRGGLKTKIGKKSYFNSRPSAMGDERGCGIDVLARVISIHAPPRGATAVAARFKQRYISIHAPPRGATLSVALAMWCVLISIHAPPRGATRRRSRDGAPVLFQFTPLREGRHDGHSRRDARQISIHAPPRGATLTAR